MEYIKKSPSRIIFGVINVIFLVLVSICFLLPMWHVICCSFSDPQSLNINTGVVLWPLGTPTLAGYKIVVKNTGIWKAYGNTLLYVAAGTTFSMIMTTIGGYCLSRKSFGLRRVLTLFISFTMLFDGGLIPTYMVVKSLGLIQTRWSVIIPGAVSVMNLIIMRTAFEQVPSALEEAARIDGANHFQILCKIYLPLTKATTAVIALFYAVAKWNSWFHPSIYLTGKRDLYPIQLILKEVLISNTMSDVGSASEDALLSLSQILVQYVVIVVATLPILCIYPFVQKYFTKGVMIGAVKG